MADDGITLHRQEALDLLALLEAVDAFIGDLDDNLVPIRFEVADWHGTLIDRIFPDLPSGEDEWEPTMTATRVRVTEAADRLGLTIREVLDLVDTGQLRAVRVPNTGMAIPVDELDRYLAAHPA